MKCDDDTFVRVDAVIKEVKKVPDNKSFYIGNINYYHKPLRYGKWAVTYEVPRNPSLCYLDAIIVSSCCFRLYKFSTPVLH